MLKLGTGLVHLPVKYGNSLLKVFEILVVEELRRCSVPYVEVAKILQIGFKLISGYNTRNRKLSACKESGTTENYVIPTLATECLRRHERTQ